MPLKVILAVFIFVPSTITTL